MKFAICLMTVGFAVTAFAEDTDRISVLSNSFSQQEADSVIDVPILPGQIVEQPDLQGPIPFHSQAPVPVDLVVLPEPPIQLAPATTIDCRKCCQLKNYKPKCCCKRTKKYEATFCLLDPNGCEYEVCAKIPAHCVDESPTVNWQCRLLGRKVATLCWECCDHQIKVIVKRCGKVKVRD